MFRLILLTIVGLFGILAMYGTPEMAGGNVTPQRIASRSVPAPAAATAVRSQPRPARLAPGVSADDLIRAALAAPAAQPPVFAGPRLRASPEFAGATAAATAAAPGDAPAQAGALLYVAGSAVNVRASAPDGAVIGSLAHGAAVRPVGATTEAWVEVEVDTGGGTRRGFVSARYLSRNQPG